MAERACDRAAPSESPSVHSEAPASTRSLSRNWPGSTDSTGNPLAAAAVTPGVVNRKLSVLKNSSTASALPGTEIRGASGRSAMSSAAMISAVPSTAANVRTLKMWYTQLSSGLWATSGWMATASYVVYFKTPIQAMTTTSPYRTSSRPATATGCSAVTAATAGGCVVLDITRSFRCPIFLLAAMLGWPARLISYEALTKP